MARSLGHRVLAFEALPSNLMLFNLSLCLNTGFDDATRLQVKQVAVSDASECKVAASRDEASRGILLCSKVRPPPLPPPFSCASPPAPPPPAQPCAAKLNAAGPAGRESRHALMVQA